MSNSAVATQAASTADIGADLLLAVFTGAGGTQAANGDMQSSVAMIAETVSIGVGIEPSIAVVSVSMNAFGPGQYDEAAFSVAFKSTGIGKFLMRSRASVFGMNSLNQTVPLMSGVVVKVTHAANDTAVLTIYDDRFLLSRVTVTGQAQYDPSDLNNGLNGYGFVHNAHCEFNQHGYPNCIDMPSGNGTIPVFAPTIRFGWKPTNYDEPLVGKATTQARSWRVADAIAYLRMMHYDDLNGGGLTSSRPPFNIPIQGYQLDAGLIWPSGSEELFSGAAGGTSRVLRATKLEGLTLDAALTKVAQRAGPYELLPLPSPHNDAGSMTNTSTLGFADMRGRAGSAQALIPALYGISINDAMQEGGAIAAGHWTESILNYHDGANIIGDAPVYEAAFSTFVATSPATELGGGHLEPAWSADDEKNFKQYLTDNGKNQTAFTQACALYPLVYAAWRVKHDYMTMFTGTKWGSYKAMRAHPKIRPCLVTAYQQDATGGNPANAIPREIPIEYAVASGTTRNWQTAGLYDNLKLSQDGQYFMIEALRDQNLTWSNSGGNIFDPGTGNMKANDIRATLAIELDFRMVETVMKNSDADMENIVKARVESAAHSPYMFTWIGEDGDYIDWNRYKSRPIGQLIPAKYGTTPFPDQASNGAAGNLFTDQPVPGDDAAGEVGRMYEHTSARSSDVRRVEGGAEFIFKRFSYGFLPGNGIKSVEGSDIAFRGVVTRTTFNHNLQEMRVEIGVAVPSDITRGI